MGSVIQPAEEKQLSGREGKWVGEERPGAAQSWVQEGGVSGHCKQWGSASDNRL